MKSHICADCRSTNIEPLSWDAYVAVGRCHHVPLISDDEETLVGPGDDKGRCPRCPRTWSFPTGNQDRDWEWERRSGFDARDLDPVGARYIDEDEVLP